MVTILRRTAREIVEGMRASVDRYERAEVIPLIAERLRESIEADEQALDEIITRAAREALTDVERQDAPHPSALQPYLFEPERFLVVGGEGERVKAASATYNDGLRAVAVLDRNFEAQSDAFFQQKRYWNARIEKWVDAPSALLIDIERDYFDWQAP